MTQLPPGSHGSGYPYGQPQYGQPQYGQPQYGQPQYGGYPQQPQGYYLPQPNPEAYTPWSHRVVAALIDQAPIFGVLFIGYFVIALFSVALFGTSSSECTGDYCETPSPSGFGVAMLVLVAIVIFVLPLAYVVWNYGYLQGTTGQSLGKKMMKFKVVGENTGLPIGFGMSLVRQIAHIADGLICNIGYLWPLWDPKRQTFADKIMATVCVAAPAPLPPLPPQPPYPQQFTGRH